MTNDSTWASWPEFKRQKVRRLLTELAAGQDLSHEHIEEAVTTVEPGLKTKTVDDEDYSDLIQEIYLEYSRNGAVD